MRRTIIHTVITITFALFLIVLSACNVQETESFDPFFTITSSPTETEVFTSTPEATPTTISTATETPQLLESSPTSTVVSQPETTETEETPAGSARIFETDQMEQVYVPAGEFIMGSEDIEAKIVLEGGRAFPEIPMHTVYVEAYWIDKYEVTNSQYAACVEAGICKHPYKNSSETRWHYFDDPEYSNYPVIWVSWHMAREYCEWVGRRLPTEAEWEKASRGTEGNKYPWGNDLLKDDTLRGERANFCDANCPRTIANDLFNDGYADTAPVGSYPKGASPYGAMDMSGNVWEWTGTIIQPYPYDSSDGREDLTDPYAERVWRGGPWSNGYWWMRSSVRYRSIPSYWYVNLGFRCASSE